MLDLFTSMVRQVGGNPVITVKATESLRPAVANNASISGRASSDTYSSSFRGPVYSVTTQSASSPFSANPQALQISEMLMRSQNGDKSIDPTALVTTQTLVNDLLVEQVENMALFDKRNGSSFGVSSGCQALERVEIGPLTTQKQGSLVAHLWAATLNAAMVDSVTGAQRLRFLDCTARLSYTAAWPQDAFTETTADNLRALGNKVFSETHADIAVKSLRGAFDALTVNISKLDTTAPGYLSQLANRCSVAFVAADVFTAAQRPTEAATYFQIANVLNDQASNCYTR